MTRERLFCVCSDGKEGLGTLSQSLCQGWQGRPPLHRVLLPGHAVPHRELGLGRRQLEVSQITSVAPGMSPLAGASDHPDCSCLEPLHEEGVLGQSWGALGPQQLPQSKTHQHVPPNTSQQCGQTPASSPLTLARGRTMKAPPPPDSTMMATNLGLTAQKELSHVTLETRMSSYIWSAFTGCPNTCRNLLWRTTRRLMAGGTGSATTSPPRHSLEGFQSPQASDRLLLLWAQQEPWEH